MEMYIPVPIYFVHLKNRSIEEIERKNTPPSENGVSNAARVKESP